HDLVLRAVSKIDGVHLVFVGTGPESASLRALAQQLGMTGRVRFLGNMPQADLASIYGAADVLALGSVREGWPNVLLEAMACGTPVVATGVGGVGEIVTDPIAGQLVDAREAGEFAGALRHVLQRPSERNLVRAHALKFSWEPVVHRYREILDSVAQAGRH